MTRTQAEAIEKLRSLGYAISIFTPGEVGEASADTLQDLMVERGCNYLDSQESGE